MSFCKNPFYSYYITQTSKFYSTELRRSIHKHKRCATKVMERSIYKSPWIMSWRLIKGYVTAGRQPPGIKF